jgi:hypothetical protein
MNNLFLSKENISTIWEVIIDEDIFKFLTRDIQENIFQMFTNNIKSFYEVEKIKTLQLMDLNKKYILLLLSYIKKNYPQKIPNKIKIFNEEPDNQLITYEELQNDRKTQFEKDLIKKEQEFENSINVKPPPVPEFSDKFEEKPISEMNLLIKEITNKRNYDVEQINYNYQNTGNQVNNWLKSQDTSIKLEKFNLQSSVEDNNKMNQNNKKLKYLNLEDENNITLNNVYNFNNKNNNNNNDNVDNINKLLQKNVTWGKNDEITFYNDNINIRENEVESSIFNKLKKIEITLSTEERILLLENEMKQINKSLNKIIDLIKDK